VVVTATAAPESLANVGRTLTLVTREDFDRLPIVSLDEVFRLSASADVRSRGPRGVQSDFSLRGAQFGQALVLVNGIRLNDSQSGHHNADIPVGIEDVERVELLLGAGSSLHGADAFGGTINVITRPAGPRYSADVAVGQHGLIEAAGSFGVTRRSASHRLTAELGRSSGFMPARDHDVKLARYQGSRERTSVAVAYLDKEFGANGFYGPAPSREWTDQVLFTVSHRLEPGPWTSAFDGSYRTHGDVFVYDVRNPSLSQNTHRTHAVAANARFDRRLTSSSDLSAGGGGGHDLVRSTGLGDHAFSRAGAFVELRQRFGARTVLAPGVRFDAYREFGSAWSPSVAASSWLSNRLKLRSSAGRAFRVPTFTELFYQDPNHLAAGSLDPETAWSADAGADLFGGQWSASLSTFGRWESNVIDWVRNTPDEPWRTTNLRTVRTAGLEVSGRRHFGARGLVTLGYTWLDSRAEALALLSKYVLDYAPHSIAGAFAGTWQQVSLGSRLEFKRRADGRSYWVIDGRVSRRFGRLDFHADVANVLDTAYQEIRGVDMPGRWVKIGVRVR
jgi:outer membrane cobalamin receptor